MTALARTDRFGVLQPGLSVGATTNTNTGTIGALVYDVATGVPCLLTSAHAIGVYSGGILTPDLHPIHPGQLDNGVVGMDSIGTTLRHIYNQDGDAALVRLDVPMGQGIFGATGSIFKGVESPSVSMPVRMSGRTSGIQNGTISAIGTVSVTIFGVGTISMDVMTITGLSGIGDAGAVWYSTETGNAVGLHVYHNSYQTLAYACHMETVLTELNCTLDAPTEGYQPESGTFNIAFPADRALSGTGIVCGVSDFLGLQVSAFTSEPTTYTDMDEYAQMLGYADAEALYEDVSVEDGDEYAQTQGFATAVAFLAAQAMPSLEQVLSNAGVTFS